MAAFVGILPAAGLGTRLWPNRYPKELLPMAFVSDGEHVRPIPAAALSLRAMRRAGVDRAFLVIADWKLELIRVLGDGADLGLHLAYLHREVPRGLADAVDAGHAWFADSNVLLALPDTLWAPADAFVAVRAAVEAGADLALGLFPTDRPEELGPVEHSDGRVVRVHDKPAQSPVGNTWGIAGWTPRFSALLHELVADSPTRPIGDAFQAAVDRGLDVRAVWFPGGSYADVGTTRSLSELVAEADDVR